MAYQQPPANQYADTQAGYANWLYRVASSLIDGLVVAVIAGVGFILALVVGGGIDSSGGMTAAGSIIYYVFLLAAIVVALWNQVFRQGRTGQSLGKSAVGTRLVSLQSGQPIGAGMAFVRGICHIVDSIPCYLGYLWPIWDSKRQTFADKIVSTVVVRG